MNKQIKLVAFDMDGTLLKERSIFYIAQKKGFQQELTNILKDQKQLPYEKTIQIAQLLKGIKQQELIKIYRKIPLQNHAKEVLKKLKNKKIKTAIITDSYQLIADDLKQKLHMDFAYANNLILNQDTISGEILLNNKNLEKKKQSCCQHSICKSDILEMLRIQLHIHFKNIIAIGDGAVDICMLERAGIGIAFKAPPAVQKKADIISNDLRDILKFI